MGRRHPRDLPAWSMISQIDPSPTTPGTAYLAANHYKQDDYRPFAYVHHPTTAGAGER